MAKKSTLVRITSDEVQGEGSYVTLRKPNWQVMRSIMKAQASSASDVDLGVMALEAAFPAMIADWNWTKTDGDNSEYLLPLPAQDASVIDQLDFEEIMFLIQHVTPMLSAFQVRVKN